MKCLAGLTAQHVFVGLVLYVCVYFLVNTKRDCNISCILIKLTTNINYDKRTIPFEFQGQGLVVKVKVYKYGNYLLNTIEIKLLR